jgi:hypothetical protein
MVIGQVTIINAVYTLSNTVIMLQVAIYSVLRPVTTSRRSRPTHGFIQQALSRVC